jgi:hypothetical protein
MFAYEQALHATEAWPLMAKTYGKGQYSIREAMSMLDDFEYNPPVKDCTLCSSNFGYTIDMVLSNVQDSFNGLCLDCIKKPVRKDKLMEGRD